MSDLMHCFELDRGESPQRSLTTPAMVGAFDPGDDGQAELFPRLPALAIEDVVLKQSEERLYGRVVGARAGPAHGSDDAGAAAVAGAATVRAARTPKRRTRLDRLLAGLADHAYQTLGQHRLHRARHEERRDSEIDEPDQRAGRIVGV